MNNKITTTSDTPPGWTHPTWSEARTPKDTKQSNHHICDQHGDPRDSKRRNTDLNWTKIHPNKCGLCRNTADREINEHGPERKQTQPGHQDQRTERWLLTHDDIILQVRDTPNHPWEDSVPDPRIHDPYHTDRYLPQFAYSPQWRHKHPDQTGEQPLRHGAKRNRKNLTNGCESCDNPPDTVFLYGHKAIFLCQTCLWLARRTTIVLTYAGRGQNRVYAMECQGCDDIVIRQAEHNGANLLCYHCEAIYQWTKDTLIQEAEKAWNQALINLGITQNPSTRLTRTLLPRYGSQRQRRTNPGEPWTDVPPGELPEANGRLSAQKAVDVCNLYNEGMEIPDIAIRYRVSSASISSTLRGKSWAKQTNHVRPHELRPRPEYISVSGLMGKRGWTRQQIDEILGEPDVLARNPHYSTAAPMRLYDMRNVTKAENSMTPKQKQRHRTN